MLKIDGAYLEGGGQIARTALSFSALTGKPFEIYDIRKGRKDSGLKAQHLHGVKALKELCNASVIGDELGSSSLVFIPRKIIPRTLSVDIGTAGSITLLFQSILIPCMFAEKPVRLKITGGTDVAFSPPVDYFQNVFLPQIRNFADSEFSIMRRGYYPKGGGKVELKIKPKFSITDSFDDFLANLREKTKPLNFDSQGELALIKGISHASSDLQKNEVAERQAKAAKRALSILNCPVKIDSAYSETFSTGSGITLWAVFTKNNETSSVIGSDSLGEKSKRAELVGEEAAKNLLEEIKSKAAIDSHMADQILPFLALSKGIVKTSRITNHARTNIYTIEQFFGKRFEVDEEEKIIKVL